MNDLDLEALCLAVDSGDVAACGPLLDRLKEQADPRHARLTEDLGLLFEWLDDPDRARDPRPCLSSFLYSFRRLFWPELRGGAGPALARLAAVLSPAADPDDPDGRRFRLYAVGPDGRRSRVGGLYSSRHSARGAASKARASVNWGRNYTYVIEEA